ncbi:MAG: DUF5681 domain-containing protein [Xanthobacteraceae bacterium]
MGCRFRKASSHVRRKKKISAKRYAVGYGKPPVRTRFKRGQSGNFQGRPTGTRNARSMARAALEQRIVVSSTGVRKRMSVREIAFQRLAEKAMAGDLKALNFLLGLEDALQSPEGDATPTSAERSLKILQQFFERQLQGKKQ